MVSPCGVTYFARGGKVGKAPPGAAHGHLQCPIPPPPDPPFILRGSHQGARWYPTGAGKGQDTVPRAARCAAVGGFAALRMRRTSCGCCRSVFFEQAYAPTRAIAPSFPPSRGGSVVAPPPGLVQDTQNCCEHAPAPGPHPSAVSLTSASISALDLPGYHQPRGVHPIGGPKPP